MVSRKNRRGRNTSVAIREKSNPNYTVVINGPSATPVMMPRNMRAYLNEGYRNKTAFRVVGQIARSGAGIKWKHYYDKSREREYTSSPLLDLWDRPNQGQGGTKFRENLLGYYCLTGNSYILGINASLNPKAKFDELHVLRPDLTKVHISEQLEPDYYEFGPTYPYKRYDKPQVMHSKLFAANDDVYGLSPIEVAALLIDIQKAGQKWNLGLMSNMAAPSGAWVTKQILNDPDYRNLKKEIHEKFSGPRNAREPVILHGGVEWQGMSMTPLELDFLNSDDKTDRDIAGIFFNFPVFLLGLSDTTFNNQAEAKHYLYTDICFPILDMFVDDLNSWLTPRYGGWLDYDREDVETIQERIQAGKAQMSDRAMAEFAGGTTTFLEAREVQGKERLAVKDFIYIKEVPVHIDDLDEYIAATTSKVISPPEPPPQLMLPQPNQTTITEEPNDENSNSNEDDQNNGKNLPQIIATKVLDLSTAEEKEAYFKTIEERREKWEAEITKRLQAYFKSEQKAIRAAIERSNDADGVQNRVNHAIDTLGQSGVLKHLIVSLYQDVGTDSGSQVLSELKSDHTDYRTKDSIPFDLLYTPDVLIFLLTMAAEKVTQINDYTKALLQSELEEGVRAGESLIDIAKRIDDLYLLQIIPDRSLLIAQTEVHEASEYGSYEGAKSSGLMLMKVFLATDDSHTREEHRKADGQKVGMDEPFEVGGSKMMYPGDTSLGAKPDMTIGCRCTHFYERVQVDDVNKALQLFIQGLPRSEVSREQYRELLKSFAGKHGHHDQRTHGRRRTFKDGLAGKTIKEKEEFLSQNGGKKWIDGLSKSERRAVEDYTGSAYKNMNKTLRTGGTKTKQINDCQSALLKGKAPVDMVVTRGYGNSQLDNFIAAAKGKKFFQEKGFASTTIKDNPTFTGFRVNVKVFKGAPGAYIAPISSLDYEREFLIPHDAKFKVTKASIKNGEYVFDVEYKGTTLGKSKMDDLLLSIKQNDTQQEEEDSEGKMSDKFVCPADGLIWLDEESEDEDEEE
jgi:HK97 family phage portal protein